jgi:hypothetical protein
MSLVFRRLQSDHLGKITVFASEDVVVNGVEIPTPWKNATVALTEDEQAIITSIISRVYQTIEGAK